MPGTLASLLIKLGLDATGVEQGVARAEKSIGSLSTGAGTAMKVAGSLIGGGLAFAAKGAMEMEDRAARFQADTGASAEEARHFADSVNAAAGSSLVSMDDIATSATGGGRTTRPTEPLTAFTAEGLPRRAKDWDLLHSLPCAACTRS
jgi:hypothetical protein